MSEKPQSWAGLPYPYRGLIYCAECGCKITFETKKGKYVYGHCTRSKYKHEIAYVSEDDLTEQFSQILGDIYIPDDVYVQILEEIDKVKSDEKNQIEAKRSAIQTELHKYQTRIDKMYNDRLDGLILDKIYRQKYKEFTEKQRDLQDRLQNIELLNSKHIDDFAHLLSLANKAPKLFKQANFEEKREIIYLTLSNLCLNMDLLGWKYKKPFDLMAFCNNNSSWQGH